MASEGQTVSAGGTISWKDDLTNTFKKAKEDSASFWQEFKYELTPPKTAIEPVAFWHELKTWFHIPYLPAFHQPGWLSGYIAGPYDLSWVESLLADFWAGITVGLTLIPQGLSYATLANLQPIQGLYAAILPSAMYTFFGSSLQLAVGPVAIVSLLTGQVVNKYVPNYAQPAYYEEANDVAATVAFTVGIILIIGSLLNLGNLIRYLSKPMISGFTSGAACVIGLNQLKNTFGFSNSDVPQQGQTNYEYNHEVMSWFRYHFFDRYHYTVAQLTMPTGKKATQAALDKWHKTILYEGERFTNTYAIQISFSLFASLMVILWAKAIFKETAERKKKLIFRAWVTISSLAPFIGIIIAAHMAWRIKRNDHYSDPHFVYKHEYNAYSLKIIGKVPPGLDFLRTPTFRLPIGDLLGEAIPIAIVAYMESYSVARTIAAQIGQLHILNASQELWANGLANLLATFSSAYPVSGSFSRSALNFTCGARTPLSKATTMVLVIIALKTLTGTFQYIPQAALSAVIMAAIYNLISFSDLWDAWKNNKKDFFTILVTWAITFTFSTEFGLAAGFGAQFLTLVIDIASSPHNKPEVTQSAKENDGVAVIRLKQDLNFLTTGRLRDNIQPLYFVKPIDSSDHPRLIDKILTKFAFYLDQILLLNKPEYADFLPKAIAIDLSLVNVIDYSGLFDLHEIMTDIRRYGVKAIIINATPSIEAALIKYGIVNDFGPELDVYSNLTGNIPLIEATNKPVFLIPGIYKSNRNAGEGKEDYSEVGVLSVEKKTDGAEERV